MSKEKEWNEALMSEEELDQVAGGRTYHYELVDTPRGKGYRVSFVDAGKPGNVSAGTMYVPEAKWDLFKKRHSNDNLVEISNDEIMAVE